MNQGVDEVAAKDLGGHCALAAIGMAAKHEYNAHTHWANVLTHVYRQLKFDIHPHRLAFARKEVQHVDTV